MQKLLDKLILILCCSIFLLPIKKGALPVAVFLSAFTLSCLIFYINRRLFTFVSGLLYALLCMAVPAFSLFLPLLFYDYFDQGLWLVIAVSFSAVIRYLLQNASPFTFTLLLFCAVSLLLSFRTGHLLTLTEKYKKMRDDSHELNMILKNKNKDLLEKQDYEIHLATLNERNRIAREIHDHVVHMLSRSILQVGALITVNKADYFKEPLCDLKDTLNKAMDAIRSSVHDLHADSVQLRDAMTSLLENYSQYDTVFEYDMPEDVPRQVKYCFIAILKEALSNIVKHSNATCITVTGREHPSFYQLVITDNGSISENALEYTPFGVPAGNGIGLENMRERVSALNGILRIQAQNGFKIYISIPKQTS